MPDACLAIGLNVLGPFWEGCAPVLKGCVADAESYAGLARDAGYSATVLRDAEATKPAVLAGIRAASATLESGDTFVLCYSGHGMKGDLRGFDLDANGNFTSAWCLHDYPLLNHELYAEWGAFRAGVRVVVISDSCHSGHATRQFLASGDEVRVRTLPAEAQSAIIARSPDAFPPAPRFPALPDAAVVLLAGCQDDQTSRDGDGHGLFTQSILDALASFAAGAGWAAVFAQARDATRRATGGAQEPNLFDLGDERTIMEVMRAAPFGASN